MEPVTKIADILAGADQLSVITDKIEEVSTPDVVRLSAAAAADAYRLAANMLAVDGHDQNAREAYEKAATHYARAGATTRARECKDKMRRNPPPNDNWYDP